jgi:prepilin-type N-terminal cleavage/methylation domain-containing protein
MAGDVRCQPAGKGREAGFTLIELSVTVALLGVVMAICLGVFASMTRNEALQQDRIRNQEAGRLAMVEIGRDIRSATDVFPTTSPAGAMRDQVTLRLGDGGSPTYVRWRLATDRTVYRATLTAPNGTVISEKPVIQGLHNNDRNIPLFRYFNAANAEQSVDAPITLATDTIRVRISMASAPAPVASAFLIQNDVQLRNRTTGVTG